ncbi:MAG TPA: LysR family transcriptional regulator [Polyangia bacterium]|nr:LysR family transcriptional regulator [Polyangia bacterium]
MTATNGIDLNLVAAFTRVVELGSFTAAAAALGMPKSSVSRAISRLEDGLGVRLLQRTTRRLGLTQAGERYIAEVRGPVARVAEASSEIADSGKEPRGLVRISIAPEMGDGWISELMVGFVQRYPKIRIEMVVTNRRVNLIEEAIDLALRAGKLDDSTLVARKLAIAEVGLFAAPSYLKRRGQPRRMSDLTAHDCVLHKTSEGILPWRLSGPRGIERVEVTGPITADDLGSVRLLAIAGLGIALLPDIVTHADITAGSLVRVLPGYALRGAALHLVSVPLRHVPTRVTLLRDYLLREIPARVAGTPCALDAKR